MYTVLDPHFGAGETFHALLSLLQRTPSRPFARLRYQAATEFNNPALPTGLLNGVLAPGLHFMQMPELNVELHLWVGNTKAALQEFQGCFDAVLEPDAHRQYGRRMARQPLAMNQPESVAVVGAGIAGSSVALALCQRGVQVHLYDQAGGPATGASGNWVGAFHPHITRGDSPLSRLSRLGFEHTVQALNTLTEQGFLQKDEDWATPGHLQTVPVDEAERTRETLAQLAFPESLVRWAEPDSLLPTPLSGLYFPQGGWVKPARWVQANLQACGSLLTTHYNTPVHDLTALREQHDAVVVCSAEQSIILAPIDGAKVGVVKGQISKLQATVQPNVVLSGESYAIAPPRENWLVLGATYERPVLDLNPTPEADELNVARFRAAFPDWPLGNVVDHRCAVRAVWHDRLPAIGPVPNMPGVFMSTGFASRGLLWAALGGWLVADHCLDQPFESKLLGKIRPRGARA
ncbi:FAD-dependent 5-carboxymethylaminomethyl-2-thiouridine(34) oxidoreductase MnmC [Limnobacter thiooxidans]|uniref:FAD-dependent 5-carboxymethylaminomethyl-2-thiouridine(34) oxidoreductase MnmC n=1 Tax=Limnobacter thiooxidans TaxID=131080 RepID=UPI0030C6F0F8